MDCCRDAGDAPALQLLGREGTLACHRQGQPVLVSKRLGRGLGRFRIGSHHSSIGALHFGDRLTRLNGGAWCHQQAHNAARHRHAHA